MSYVKLNASALAQIGEGMRCVREGLVRRMRRAAGLCDMESAESSVSLDSTSVAVGSVDRAGMKHTGKRSVAHLLFYPNRQFILA
jgi:hypothetical protein